MKTPGGGGYGTYTGDADNSKDGTCKSNTGKNIHKFQERGSVFEYRQAQETV